MLNLDKPIAFLDTETTSTDIKTAKILEICIVKLFPNGDTETKTKRFNPGIPIPPDATKIHGIKDEDVQGLPLFKSFAAGLVEYLTGCDIAGFNSNRYDVPLIAREIADAGKEWDLSDVKLIDVGNIYKAKEQRTLSAGVQFYLGREHTDAHGAEADTVATLEILKAQLLKYFRDTDITTAELELISNFDKKRIDLDGKFAYAADGTTVVFTFGKHINENVLKNYGFLNWMLSKDFTADTKLWCKKFIAQIPFS